MDKKKHCGQIEITDLIASAVPNAVARRNQALDSENPLSSLSDEEAEAINGGKILVAVTTGIYPPITIGKINSTSTDVLC